MIKKSISFANLKDTKSIMWFINKEWKKNHILAVNKKFFLFQHQDKKKLNFIISKNSSKKIDGIIGFIKASKDKKSDIWTTMWKTSSRSNNPMLGISLLNFLKNGQFRTIMSSGIKFETKKIYDYLGYKTGRMKHFFYPNKNITPIIGKFQKNIKNNRKPINNQDYFVNKINSKIIKKKFPFNLYKSRVPFKDWNYFNKRYFLHPIFNYQVYGIYFKKRLVSILILREIKYKSRKILRIIDFFGKEKPFKYLGDFFLNLLQKNDYEYIDFVCYGLSESYIYSSGFVKIPHNSKKIIIPNYFYPIIKKNISIYFFVNKANLKNVKIFKGDGDQDRPN